MSEAHLDEIKGNEGIVAKWRVYIPSKEENHILASVLAVASPALPCPTVFQEKLGLNIY